MLAIANGELDKLSDLFDRYHVKIYNFFQKMNYNKVVSEDLTQEVFIKVLKHRTSYKNGNFTSWIYTIARNIFFDYYKKHKKEQTSNIEEHQISSEELSFTENHQEELEYLQTCLQKLKTSDRELIIMHKIQGIKYEQIAEITGSSANAVKVKTHRVLNKLKEIYFQSTEIKSN